MSNNLPKPISAKEIGSFLLILAFVRRIKMNPNEDCDDVWWLNLFLARTFILACVSHTNFGNHLNQYCIDSEMAACQQCMAEGTHDDHRVITIYRLVYKGILCLDQMSTHNDCSRIQDCDGVWWLNLFLARTFFLACGSHTNFGNHLNHYCIDCDMAACQHCMAEGTHADHKVLTIHRLVYKEVVSLYQMSTHLDCSRIQPYASNGRQVLALNPLPHYNSGQLNRDRASQTCTQILLDPNSYSYCSVTSKPSVKQLKPAAAGHDDAGAGTCSKRSDSRKSRRKGIPHKAPLF